MKNKITEIANANQEPKFLSQQAQDETLLLNNLKDSLDHFLHTVTFKPDFEMEEFQTDILQPVFEDYIGSDEFITLLPIRRKKIMAAYNSLIFLLECIKSIERSANEFDDEEKLAAAIYTIVKD